MKTLSIAAALLMTSTAFAGNSFQDKCSDIESCARVVSEMTGQKYLFGKDVKGQLFSTSNVEITRDNVETLFTMMLNMNSYTRVPVPGSTNTFQILAQRDARDSNVPTFQVSGSKTLPENKTYDLVTMVYTLNHPTSGDEISRVLRSFSPANARIISIEKTGQVIVTDQAQNVAKLYGMIKAGDVKTTVQAKKKKE